jgi:hypothetical protein
VKRLGAWLIVLGGAAGLGIAIYNYFSATGFLAPLSNTAGTPGALLVIGSTALMLAAGLVLLGRPHARFVILFFLVGVLLDVFGTGFAAILLESPPLLAAMAAAGIGWLAWIFARQPSPSA